MQGKKRKTNENKIKQYVPIWQAVSLLATFLTCPEPGRRIKKKSIACPARTKV
jgi:hypothetical protein